jgi:ketosteroid isomerase-like protein
MTPSSRATAAAFVEAINRHDVDALYALMSDGHRFIDSLGAIFDGREAMRAGWAAYFRMVPDYVLTVRETLCDGAVVVMLGTASGTYAKDGSRESANRWEIPAALRAEVHDGRVTEWQVYADNEPLRRRMAANP